MVIPPISFYWFLLITAVLFFVGCAQVDRPNVVQPASQVTATSKTVAQESERIAEYGAMRVLKRKIAIARFSNETNYGRSFLVDEHLDPIGKQAVDILSTKLQQTNKFVLLERADLDRINAELSIADRQSLQNMADYLVLGSITGFGRRTEGETGVFSRTKRQIAFASVSVRLVDVYTGEIIYSDEGHGEAYSEVGTTLGVGTRAGYDSTLNDRVIDAAISNLANNIIENLLEKPWRSYILAKDGETYFIAGGPQQGIRKGDRFTVLKKGRTVHNPQTGMDIMLPGTPVSTLEVVSFAGQGVQGELALARAVDDGLPDGADFSEFMVIEKSLVDSD